MNRKIIVITALLFIGLISSSIVIALSVANKQTPLKPLNKQFYVGVEFAYSDQFVELKALVDKVKDFTNLFVIGAVGVSFNKAVLNQCADYIFSSGLNFIVLFTGLDMYNYDITEWMQEANLKYGDKFLGIYRFDEPGGNQLDRTQFMLINDTTTYAQTAGSYVGNLSTIVNYYFEHGEVTNIFTSDYGLYWFDYSSNYTTVFGEIAGNQTHQDKERMIALDRGAAESFNKSWGVIVTWKYAFQEPYLENGTELYNDLSMAYSAGASYAVVFSYPNVTDSNYGTLTNQHFEALRKFWINIHNNPNSFASNNANVAYVIPKDYGFSFRNPNDSIWGLFLPDTLTQKIWNDSTILLNQFGANLNILCDETEIIRPTLSNYTKVFYWNQTIT